MRIRPDWVCEIVSPKHEKQDMVDKPRVLYAAEVPHYWVLDPEEQILLIHRWSRDGYIVVQRAAASEKFAPSRSKPSSSTSVFCSAKTARIEMTTCGGSAMDRLLAEESIDGC